MQFNSRVVARVGNRDAQGLWGRLPSAAGTYVGWHRGTQLQVSVVVLFQPVAMHAKRFFSIATLGNKWHADTTC
jgi:hypothetical protein